MSNEWQSLTCAYIIREAVKTESTERKEAAALPGPESSRARHTIFPGDLFSLTTSPTLNTMSWLSVGRRLADSLFMALLYI